MDENEIKEVKPEAEDAYEKLKLEHRFSVTDSWYELLAVIFMVIYVITKTCFFIYDGGYSRGWMPTVGFILDLILAVFVVCTFCAVVEVQEKADITNFNMGLMAKSLHDYYHDIADRLDEFAGYDSFEEEAALKPAEEEGTAAKPGGSNGRYRNKKNFNNKNSNKNNGEKNSGDGESRSDSGNKSNSSNKARNDSNSDNANRNKSDSGGNGANRNKSDNGSKSNNNNKE